MKIKLYFSQTFFTLEQQLLDFFSSKKNNDFSIFISSHSDQLDIPFLKSHQALVLPYTETLECHKKISTGLLEIIGRNNIKQVVIHFPVSPLGISLLGMEMIRHLSQENNNLELHVWDSNIEDVINRQGLTNINRDAIKVLRDELNVFMSNLNVPFILRADNKLLFYICHYLFDTTYHLVRSDLLGQIKNKGFYNALIKTTTEIDAECIKESDKKIQLMLIKTLGISHDVYKKIEQYNSDESMMVTYSDTNYREHQWRHRGLGKYSKQFICCFLKLLVKNNEFINHNRIIVHNLKADGSIVDEDIAVVKQSSVQLEDECSLFILHALGAIPGKVSGYPDIYLLAFPTTFVDFLILHENMDYASTQKYHHLLVQAGYPDKFIYTNEADTLLEKSGKLDVLVTMEASLGDCMFALGAMKALRKVVTNKIIFMTHRRYTELARRNPYIAEVVALEDQVEHALMIYRQTELSLSAYFCSHQHTVGPFHLIDACLKSIGIKPSPEQLDMEVVISANEGKVVDDFLTRHQLANNNIVLLHANIGDPNRTWSAENWNALAEKFINSGWRVIAIGNTNNKYVETQVHTFNNPAVINAVDKFSILESIYLMRKCQLLVATDSGPVALAGASDIAIVSIYSIVPGYKRIAYRHGSLGWNALCIDLKCRYGHCMQLAINADFCNKVLNTSVQIRRLNNWCPLGDTQGLQVRYSCVKNYPAEKLFEKITGFLSSDKYTRQPNN
ncbi:glycosyltransferase family 9 protein [Buttiauxella gaviniae]|uniref:glycosyltransferase family 9 protein n=1 Tax=Buttiauxella gaviniae TaxID=82990 RepID=UPI00397650F8